ncbi:MAG: hypothetical protein LBL07_18270 [Tannerella sp.]|jgi:hypothetical protein|nr:hypothetical protein [Tannerella sp.]
MTIQELLEERKLDSRKSIKLVRHTVNNHKKISALYKEYIEENPNARRKDISKIANFTNLYELYKKDKDCFLWYQRGQKNSGRKAKPFHENKNEDKLIDYIVSFIGRKGTTAIFIGVYKVVGVKNERKEKEIEYDLQEEIGFKDLSGTISIEWGNGAKAWVQNYSSNPKEIINIEGTDI